MDMQTFLATHPVFTRKDVDKALADKYSGDRGTSNARLNYHLRVGHVIQIQRGLYASVPAGTDPASLVPDPWLVAGKSAEDAVIAYHSALQFRGRSYSVSNEYLFLSNHAVRTKEFRGCWFRRVAYPKALRTAGKEHFGVETEDRQGLDIRVASLERALVDLLDRPDLGGGWEETWRSLESVEYYEIEQVVNYALFLRNATTAAKVGFFLEQHRNQLMVDEAQLSRLRQAQPRQPHYMESRTTGRLVAGWNLIVPESILTHAWGTDL